jgi:hypothetical protein
LRIPTPLVKLLLQSFSAAELQMSSNFAWFALPPTIK